MITKEEKERYYDLHNIVRNIVGNNYFAPPILIEDIKISREDWIAYPMGVDVKTSPNPQISVSMKDFHRYIVDKTVERGSSYVGIVFNSHSSVDKFENMMKYNKSQRESFMKELKMLPDIWKIALYRKVKDHCDLQVPEYDKVIEEKANTINNELITKIFSMCDVITLDGKKEHQTRKEEGIKGDYTESPRIEISCQEQYTDENFNVRMTIAYKLWNICYNIQNNELLKQIKAESKELKGKKQKLNDLIIRIENNKDVWTVPTIKLWTDHKLKIEKEIQILESNYI